MLALPAWVTENYARTLQRLYRHSRAQIDGREIRRQTLLDERIVYLNTGTLGACPKHVFEVTQQSWQALERNPAVVGFHDQIRIADEQRRLAAEFLGAGPEEVAFTRNTTEAMNLIAEGMELQPGDEILTTNHEHPGGYVGWEYVCRRRGAQMVRVDLDHQFRTPEEIVALFREKITPRTRVLSVAHVLFTTGLRMPIRQLSRLAHEHGLFLAVDGAQVPGMLQVNVKSLGCDSYASSSHKWLMAPKGSGLLYLRKEVQARVQPLMLAGGFRAYTAQTGTRNFPALIGHGAAIAWQQLLGTNKIEARVLELARYTYRRLQEFSTIRLLRPQNLEQDSGMVAFALSDRKNAELVKALGARGIVVKRVPKMNAIRISTHIYNHEEEIDRLATAMREEGVR